LQKTENREKGADVVARLEEVALLAEREGRKADEVVTLRKNVSQSNTKNGER